MVIIKLILILKFFIKYKILNKKKGFFCSFINIMFLPAKSIIGYLNVLISFFTIIVEILFLIHLAILIHISYLIQTKSYK